MPFSNCISSNHLAYLSPCPRDYGWRTHPVRETLQMLVPMGLMVLSGMILTSVGNMIGVLHEGEGQLARQQFAGRLYTLYWQPAHRAL